MKLSNPEEEKVPSSGEDERVWTPQHTEYFTNLSLIKSATTTITY